MSTGQKQVIAIALVALLAFTACAGTQRLGQYDFRGGTLAIITFAPEHPAVLTTGTSALDPDDWLGSLIRTGSEVVREIEIQRFRARLDSAAVAVDVTDRLSARALDQTSRHLRAVPVSHVTNSDFELEVRIRRFGIAAGSWNAGTHFFVEADLLLVDGTSGRRIWRSSVTARDPVVARGRAGRGGPVGDVVTAIQLAGMSQEEIERELEALADFAADRLTLALARDLDRTRR